MRMLNKISPFYSPITFSITAEDYRIVEQALRPTSNAAILCIASAGDTPLNLLRLDPARIDVVDLNFAQLCETVLKAEAMKHLSLSQFYTLIGVIRNPKLALSYYDYVRLNLPANVRHFWDNHHHIIKRGVLWQGGVQKMFRVLRRVLWLMIGPRGISELKRLSTREQAEQFYYHYICTKRFQTLFKFFVNRVTYRLFYPPAGFRQLPAGMSPHQFSLLKVKDILLSRPFADNPYLFPFIFESYPSIEIMPPYLNPECYEIIRSRVERLNFIHRDLAEHLQQASDVSMDSFALCNVMDWMDEIRLSELLTHIIRVARKSARILIFSRSQVLTVPDSLTAHLRLDHDLGKRLELEDRVGYYTAVNVLEVMK